MWQRDNKRNSHGSVTKNDVARPGRTAPLVLVVFDESPQGTDGSQFESLPGTSGNIIPGRTAPTGPVSHGPNSVEPQPVSVRLWTPLAAPSFARGHPWTPRACRSPAGSPASPPSRHTAIATKGFAPGPLGDARLWPGPRLRRPAIPLSPTKGCLPLETRNRTIVINYKN